MTRTIVEEEAPIEAIGIARPRLVEETTIAMAMSPHPPPRLRRQRRSHQRRTPQSHRPGPPRRQRPSPAARR